MTNWWNNNFEIIGFGDESDKLKEKIKKEVQKIEENKPEEGKQYLLIGKAGQKSIAKGNTWKESEINGN